MPTSSELDERASFFRSAANKFVAEVNNIAVPNRLVIREEAIDHAVKLYFLLSDAYKTKRVHKPDEHRTEPYKIAAITTATLSGVCLLEPENSTAVSSELVALSNEVFSVYCACAILNVVKWEVPDMILTRHYLALANLELPACTEYQQMVETSSAAALALASLELRPNDLFALDMLVNTYLEWWRVY